MADPSGMDIQGATYDKDTGVVEWTDPDNGEHRSVDINDDASLQDFVEYAIKSGDAKGELNEFEAALNKAIGDVVLGSNEELKKQKNAAAGADSGGGGSSGGGSSVMAIASMVATLVDSLWEAASQAVNAAQQAALGDVQGAAGGDAAASGGGGGAEGVGGSASMGALIEASAAVSVAGAGTSLGNNIVKGVGDAAKESARGG